MHGVLWVAYLVAVEITEWKRCLFDLSFDVTGLQSEKRDQSRQIKWNLTYELLVEKFLTISFHEES